MNIPVTYRNEQIRHTTRILFPIITVLSLALLDISECTVADHNSEEKRVKPRERAAEAGDKTPRDGKVQITGIVDLAGKSVYCL
jgi:hypothetical protein